MSEPPLPRTGLEVAVVGLAGHFPGARDLETFWRNLCDGVESVSFFSDDELLASGVPRAWLTDPRFVRAAAVLDDADRFDAAFFGYNPREAELMDPQQRLFLECAWEALEDAGYDSLRYPGLIGVYGGVATNRYVLNLLSRPELMESMGGQILIVNDKDFLCTRVSYKLALEGPSVVVQSACSTSLVAVHLACQALVAGDCDLALAGGVAVSFPQKTGYLYSEGGILSPDGHCRTFDRNARGTVSGQGVGLVVLKRLESAMEDGDTIRAVILGSALNNDGAAKAGYTAPRVDGQARAIRSAHLAAEVDPATVTYVEAHGTATELGDPIEIAALTQAFRAGTDRRGFCSLGSVKTNIGHLDNAAGIAGLIKVTLALEHRELPPSLHFEEPLPEMRLAESPFYVQTQHAPWPAGSTPRRAGLSSFGIGGTNAHLVLEEAPPVPPAEAPARAWQLLPLSARTEAALGKAMERLAGRLRRSEGDGGPLALADVAYTLQRGRREMEHRAALVCRDLGEAARILEERDLRRLRTGSAGSGPPSVAFLLPGLGDHHVGMGSGLYRGEPAFREAVDRCAEILGPELKLDLREILYPERGTGPAPKEPERDGGVDLRRMLRPEARAGDGGLERTALAQPALFVLEYALAQLWMSWGIRPRALFGYSLGEYTAACLADVLPLEGALLLVARRARAIEALPPGSMLAVPLPEGELRPRLGADLSLAAVNGPALCVAAGSPEAVTALADRLAAEGIVSRPLRTSHAFHSRMMEPVAAELRSLVASLELNPPRIPYLSNVTGTWIQPSEATDPDYWVRHLLQPVRFGDGVGEIWREPGWLLLEVGPGRSLGSLALQHGAAGPERVVAASLPSEPERREDAEVLLEGVARLWLAGAPVDWQALHEGERRRRVPLPTYPFERQRFWIEPVAGAAPRDSSSEPLAAGKLADPARWFHAPAWRMDARPVRPREPEGAWLVLSSPRGLGSRLAGRLRAAGCDVAEAIPGEAFAELGEGRYALDPGRGADYTALLSALDLVPRRIVHLWSLFPAGEKSGRSFAEMQALGCHSLLLLAQALERRGSGEPVEICAVADGLCRVERGDFLDPDKAPLLGPVRVIPWEHAGISCRALDVIPEDSDGGLAAQILAELTGGSSEPLVALRGEDRWLPILEPVPLEEEGRGISAPLREGGVYLVTGGLGSLGLALVLHLACTVRARVALLDTAPMPEPPPWEGGAEVLALTADVTDAAAVEAALERVRERFGRIEGAFHLAAQPGANLVRWTVPEGMLARLAPPVLGAKVLAEALEADRPDFLALFSSLEAWTGGAGQVEAASAGAFLDAFAADRRSRGPGAVLAVHWCDWQAGEQGGGAQPLAPALVAEAEERRRLWGLRPGEGIEALRRILASGLRRVAVSARDLREIAAERPAVLRRLGELVPAPRLGAPAGPVSADDVERTVAGIWRELLGVPQVELHDDFFQIGGHSLLGLQVLVRVREIFAVDLPLRALFEAPTLGGMVALIREHRDRPDQALLPEVAPDGRLDAEDLLDRIDDLSEGEMDALLAELATAEEEMDA